MSKIAAILNTATSFIRRAKKAVVAVAGTGVALLTVALGADTEVTVAVVGFLTALGVYRAKNV